MRAVIFDLWDTLADWPVEPMRSYRSSVADRLGIGLDEFERRYGETYTARQTGPLADAYRALGLADEHLEEVLAARRERVREALVPREGALETLRELRRRGKLLALISVCAGDVPELWPETPFAPLFDAAVFSATCGLMKPQPEIYLRACAELGVEPDECLYVGDGANDELAGARRVGMTPVLVAPDGRDLVWEEVKRWEGPRVRSLPEVLALA